MTLVSTPAILLRGYPYSETSQILRFFTRDAGVVSVVAKGVRKMGGMGKGIPSTLGEGILAFHYRENRDLQTFRDFTSTNPRRALAQDPIRFAGGSLLGEVILQHAGSDPNPVLFLILSGALDSLETLPPGGALQGLLMEVWSLVGALGYAPRVRECVACDRPLRGDEMGRFDFGEGGIRCSDCLVGAHGPRLGPRAREQLLALLDRNLREELLRPRAHLRLASDFIIYHISGGSPLRSMAVLEKLIPKDHA